MFQPKAGILLAVFLGLAPGAWAWGAGEAKPKVPEDLGPAAIDISSYPEEYQRTYREVFLPVFSFLGGAARAINSPIIELDPQTEERERRENPELFADSQLAQISRDGWKKRVEDIYHRPACCGACPVLNREKARALWRFLVYDSIQRKTGARARAWLALRKELFEKFGQSNRVKEIGK